jgi:hypothetical protein
MLKKIAITLAAAVVILLLVIATRPANFKIERSADMRAPSWLVFGLVNDFRQWHVWSPWEKLDPAMQKTFGEKSAGEGAVYSWTGNDQVGEGRMTITEAKAAQYVKLKLEFLKPWKATNQATFTFAPQGSSTKVSWAMEGEYDFMGKAFSLFADMDAMVGKDFEQGLAMMGTVAEAEFKRLEEEKKKLEAAKAAATAAMAGADSGGAADGAQPATEPAAAAPAAGNEVKPASVPAPAPAGGAQ